MLGLVLTAGGARGAYQAGVLKRIGELPRLRQRPSPFQIVAGASAGAINGAMIAARSAVFRDATQTLAQLWGELSVHNVFQADAWSLGLNGLRFIQDLTFGGIVGAGNAQSLLDTAPLRRFLGKHLPMADIADAIRKGFLYAVAVSATSYHSGKSFTFIQGRSGHPLWTKSRRVTLAVPLTVDHICASAAIPLIFPPVRLRSPAGDFYFGDGGLRLVTPLSPAIRLGATRIFAVGIRCQHAAADLSHTELAAREEVKRTMPRPPLSQICGVFMNAIFLDHLDTDLDHLLRMNEMIRAYGTGTSRLASEPSPGELREPMRIVTPLVVNPSEDLAIVAARRAHKMPRLVRYLLDGLGTPDAQSADLMSYLLFDATYTNELIDIGYEDASRRIDEIEDFLMDAPAAVAEPPPARASRSGNAQTVRV